MGQLPFCSLGPGPGPVGRGRAGGRLSTRELVKASKSEPRGDLAEESVFRHGESQAALQRLAQLFIAASVSEHVL